MVVVVRLLVVVVDMNGVLTYAVYGESEGSALRIVV
jgi:hypothetical protein